MLTVLAIVLCTALLALLTRIGCAALERRFPFKGRFIEVAGARLHAVEIGPRDAAGPPIVMIHGASANLESMRQPLGELLARRHRVILIDRPGHGGSTRERVDASTPAIQAAMIDEALGQLGVTGAIFVLHSWAGALGPVLALDHPVRVAGLVMLAPVTHPWRGGVGRFNWLVTLPVVGPLLAHMLPVPLGWFLAEPGARGVFAPQPMPERYLDTAAIRLVLRPRTFINNAWDLVTLKPQIATATRRYGELRVPITVISGDADNTVWIDIHARAFAREVAHVRLVELPGVGHMPQNADPERIVAEIDEMIAALAHPGVAAKN